MPALQRLQHLTVFGKIHVVRNLGRVIDVHVIHGRAPSRFLVMPGLVPGIHVLLFISEKERTWMAGTSPAMTQQNSLNPRHVELRLLAGAVAAQRAVLADRVGAL